MSKFNKLYSLILEDLGQYSRKYITAIEKEEDDRKNWVHHFVKKIEQNPQMLKDPQVVSMIANNYWYLPADKVKEWKPYIDEFYKSIKRNVTESVDDDFNYQDELVIFEREIGEWKPLKGWQWSDEGLDENQNEFEETFLSYNGQVQVYLKEDGSIDVIDPDKNHKLFKRGDYQRAKKYITSIFKVLDQADRMRWSNYE